MFRYILSRLFTGFLTLFFVSFVVFGLMELVPGNCAERYVAYKGGQSGATITRADIQAEEKRLGLDRPFIERWFSWTGGIFLKGDFGTSCLKRVPVLQLLKGKIWISFGICFAALFITYLVAIPLGIWSANFNHSFLDGGLRFVSYLGLALPNFMVAIGVMLISTIYFRDTLTGLFSDEYREAAWSLPKLFDFFSHAWLPAFILGWSSTAFQLQTVRALVLDEIDKPYVNGARGRGIFGVKLLWRYPARHTLSPVINSMGFDLNRIFNDLPIVASVLILSETGAALLEALALSNDQDVAGAIIFILTMAIVFLNLATDVFLAFFDPRLRRGLI